MPLVGGARLGPYVIESMVGSGGMGEVYRARDTRLERRVAIKILPSRLSALEDRKRFEREARTISSLDHPHICALHDIGHEDGVDYLVMELLEGETLEERLRKGPLPLEKVVRYGREIADALHVAHRAGIVHRDLKPGNIMLTAAGTKLLDFGLAKAVDPPPGSPASTTARTITAPLTAEHAILGTLAYMAPEQVEGRDVDARADVFALGVVLYEMVAGRRAFTGESGASLRAAILLSEPAPASSLRPGSPKSLDRVIALCLRKSADERWQSAQDVGAALEWTLEDLAPAVPAARRSRARDLWRWGATAAALALGTAVLWLLAARRGPQNPSSVRLSVNPPQEDAGILDDAISPDGRWLAFTASLPGRPLTLYLRRLDGTVAQAVPGVEQVASPFWSPDGKFVAFFSGDDLMKLEVPDGHPQRLCSAPDGDRGTWSADGTILFGNVGSAGILRVPASGGTPAPVTRPSPQPAGIGRDLNPCMLPDGRHFLFTRIAKSESVSGIYVGTLDSGVEPVRILPDGSKAAFAPPDHLLFVREGSLVVQHFDAASLRISGAPMEIASGIAEKDFARYAFSVSDNGVLAYRAPDRSSRLVWFDRAGRMLQKSGEPADYVHVDLSPDDSRAAVEVIDKNGDHEVRILDLSNGTSSRLTFEPYAGYPMWSPDGTHVVYMVERDGRSELAIKPASGAGQEEPVVASHPEGKWPTSWSSNGYIVFEGWGPGEHPDIWIRKLHGAADATPYDTAPSWDNYGQTSPDGHWIAFCSGGEVVVQRFPIPDGRWQVSTDGGALPRWRRDGQELFFVTFAGLWSVDVRTDLAFHAGPQRLLFSARGAKVYKNRFPYAVSRDGQRFLANITESPLSSVTIVTNWPASLK